ncbi:hypothetical protein [Apilactobacillus micheneri]|uniref:Uncharacterized protein n=2 Tax=Apilactobacillus micheneri TaxID=1899430 RepID=A0ABY2Z059_9LACO|nr:hypothetical protein [Apilactobacillus micheneri]TPR26189.1 hypothetical protein DY114_00385 [Apilactobacillus micheneri]TPR26943.1 hypothetical protein DY111_00385 [Apilactobacillus micheneri]TPR27801.1 hypothetical protein DY113_04160 [Apilactobacillus micheneri]TPR31706.1 hypothetical protein DY117_00385 [Apilactobacillus micheneri]TPR32110.1 hypothetical protein DY120_00385 [Apilactobacillus micheneri]
MKINWKSFINGIILVLPAFVIAGIVELLIGWLLSLLAIIAYFVILYMYCKNHPYSKLAQMFYYGFGVRNNSFYRQHPTMSLLILIVILLVMNVIFGALKLNSLFFTLFYVIVLELFYSLENK